MTPAEKLALFDLQNENRRLRECIQILTHATGMGVVRFLVVLREPEEIEKHGFAHFVVTSASYSEEEVGLVAARTVIDWFKEMGLDLALGELKKTGVTATKETP